MPFLIRFPPEKTSLNFIGESSKLWGLNEQLWENFEIWIFCILIYYCIQNFMWPQWSTVMLYPFSQNRQTFEHWVEIYTAVCGTVCGRRDSNKLDASAYLREPQQRVRLLVNERFQFMLLVSLQKRNLKHIFVSFWLFEHRLMGESGHFYPFKIQYSGLGLKILFNRRTDSILQNKIHLWIWNTNSWWCK